METKIALLWGIIAERKSTLENVPDAAGHESWHKQVIASIQVLNCSMTRAFAQRAIIPRRPVFHYQQLLQHTVFEFIKQTACSI